MDKAPKVVDLVRRGLDRYSEGDLDGALESWRAALKDAPHLHRVREYIAFVEQSRLGCGAEAQTNGATDHGLDHRADNDEAKLHRKLSQEEADRVLRSVQRARLNPEISDLTPRIDATELHDLLCEQRGDRREDVAEKPDQSSFSLSLEDTNRTRKITPVSLSWSDKDLIDEDEPVDDVALTGVPVVAVPWGEIALQDLDPRAVFLLSRIDGELQYSDVLEVAGMPVEEAKQLLRGLLVRGIIRSSSVP